MDEFFSDREQPVYIDTPALNLTVNNDAGLPSAVVTWTEPTVTDNSGLFTVSVSHSSGSAFDIGITTVTYTAVDASGNTASYAFIVMVEGTFNICIFFLKIKIYTFMWNYTYVCFETSIRFYNFCLIIFSLSMFFVLVIPSTPMLGKRLR